MIARRYLSQTPEFAAAVERRRADAMTLQQMEDKRDPELHDALLMVLLKPLTILCAAVSGAHEEHQRMLHAPADYLGRGHD